MSAQISGRHIRASPILKIRYPNMKRVGNVFAVSAKDTLPCLPAVHQALPYTPSLRWVKCRRRRLCLPSGHMHAADESESRSILRDDPLVSWESLRVDNVTVFVVLKPRLIVMTS